MYRQQPETKLLRLLGACRPITHGSINSIAISSAYYYRLTKAPVKRIIFNLVFFVTVNVLCSADLL